MKTKGKLGIGIAILGIALIAGSFYIKGQVEAGQQKISSTESQVNMGDKLLSLSPKAKELSKGLTGSIQQKISEGQAQVDYYTAVAKYLEIGGVILFIAGIGMVFFSKKSA